MSYNMLDNYPILKFAAMVLVAVCAGIWVSGDVRALRGASRIRREKVKFEPCRATNVETFLGPVKSVTVSISDGTKLTFRPMDKQHALGLLGVTSTTPLSLARDPKGGPAALLKTPETEVIGLARVE